MKQKLTKLSDLKAARQNPREITVSNLKHLKSSIESFGDISGIVFNERTGELISGHQRVFALKEQFGNLSIANGTILLPNGESFPIRIVNWSKEDQLAASVAANSPTNQGTFTNGISSVLNELALKLPNVYESLGFASLKPAEIAAPESWSNEHDSQSAPWDDSPEAREGKALLESIANDVKLEARFEFKVPEKLASKANKLLLNLSRELAGSTLRRLD
jgi:hypothetical protein